MKRDSELGAEAARAGGVVEPVAAVGPSDSARLAVSSPSASSAASRSVELSRSRPSPVNKPKPSFLRLHRWQALATLVALIGAGALAIRWWLGPQVATAAVLRRDFVQIVVASGHVEAPHRLDVGAQVTGTVLRIPVTEGQAV